MPDLYLPPLCTIHPWSPEAMGPQLNAWNNGMAATVAQSGIAVQNRVELFPFTLRVPISVRQFWVYNGATVNGNIDVGVYDETFHRIASTGSAVQAGASVIQGIPVTAFTLGPGRFYLAKVSSSLTATFARTTFARAADLGVQGALIASITLPLPVTLTPIANLNFLLTVFGLSTRSLI